MEVSPDKLLSSHYSLGISSNGFRNTDGNLGNFTTFVSGNEGGDQPKKKVSTAISHNYSHDNMD